jgi:hypothetical protein
MPSTLTHYRALPDPKPVVVGIGWVVECVEKRAKVETGKFEMSLEEVAGSVSGLKDTKVGFVPTSGLGGTSLRDLGKTASTSSSANQIAIQICRQNVFW